MTKKQIEQNALIIKGTEHTEEFVTQTTEEKLKEGVTDIFWKSQCCQLCSGSLPDRLNPQEQCSKQQRLECLAPEVNQIHELYKKHTYLIGNEELPELMFIEGYGYMQSHQARALLEKTGFKSIKEWEK